MPKTSIELADFARRVEFICKYILSSYAVPSTHHYFLLVHKLKEDAADLQFPHLVSIEDFHKYVKEGSEDEPGSSSG